MSNSLRAVGAQLTLRLGRLMDAYEQLSRCTNCGGRHQREEDKAACDHGLGIEHPWGKRWGKHGDLNVYGCPLCAEECHRQGIDPKGQHLQFKVYACPLCSTERHRRGIEWQLSEGRHFANTVPDCSLCRQGLPAGEPPP